MHIELSTEALIAAQYKTICPRCLTALEIVGDYAYVPLEDGSLNLHHNDNNSSAQSSATDGTVIVPPPLPSQLAPDGLDPLYDEAVKYLSQCNAITPMMLRDYFNISIERAQDLITQLEQAGCIGPYRGGAPRQILIDHREELPNPYNYTQKFDTATAQHSETEADQKQTPSQRIVSINCGSCLIWLVILAFLVFLFFT